MRHRVVRFREPGSVAMNHADGMTIEVRQSLVGGVIRPDSGAEHLFIVLQIARHRDS